MGGGRKKSGRKSGRKTGGGGGVVARSLFEDQAVAAIKEVEEQEVEEKGEVEEGPAYVPTPEDMKMLNSILGQPAWEKVEARVQELQAGGQLTENLLQAAVHLLGVCETRGEPEEVTQMLTKVASLVAYTLSSSHLSAELILIDVLMKLEPEVNQGPAKERMVDAFAGEADKGNFLESLQEMLTSLLDQNEPMEALLEKTVEENQDESFTGMIEMVKTRKLACARMKVLISIAEGL
eukprot:CAMPEP_0196590556 /NCGR_PEP_ID=MMETSP1081-20130531/66933_1 /TAXON_ID=36882 /ORGANISM="Pyramimonas amylifera, Strain CCMP720" /LENGTH=235 /DNA_ID=CAMNT_0041913699 /DNA_START=228 /DNA_END=935 /DNA_ORIENTATION=+